MGKTFFGPTLLCALLLCVRISAANIVYTVNFSSSVLTVEDVSAINYAISQAYGTSSTAQTIAVIPPPAASQVSGTMSFSGVSAEVLSSQISELEQGIATVYQVSAHTVTVTVDAVVSYAIATTDAVTATALIATIAAVNTTEAVQIFIEAGLTEITAIEISVPIHQNTDQPSPPPPDQPNTPPPDQPSPPPPDQPNPPPPDQPSPPPPDQPNPPPPDQPSPPPPDGTAEGLKFPQVVLAPVALEECILFPTDGTSVVVENLGDGVSVPIELQKSPDISVRRKLLQVELVTLFVNDTQVASDGSVMVDNGDKIKIQLCASDQYGSELWVDMYVGTGLASVQDRVSITTLEKPTHDVAVAFDGQTYEVCSGDAVEVTWDGTHNIQEVSGDDCGSSTNIGNEIIGFKTNDHVRVFVADELAATPGQTRYFKCDSHCTSAKFAVTCPNLPPLPSPPPLPLLPPLPSPPPLPLLPPLPPPIAYPEAQKYSRYALYAESPLATPANLVELRINLADGSSVNGTTVSRIDAASFASTLNNTDLSAPALFDGDHSTVAITTATTAGPLTFFDMKSPLEATGGRLLVEGGAPSGLALYGSNDAGQNWTRVASLDVISTARNYGGGAHDVFGAAPVGSHVYRFVAKVNASSPSVPQIGDVSAYLADGTELVFPASELTFLKPLASAATGAAAMTADTTFAALAAPVVDGDGLFSLTTIEPVHKFSLQIKSLEDGVAVYRDDVLVSAHDLTRSVVDMFTHRVSHFLAVVGSGTSPAVSEFRAWYGATRAIVGAHDAREILDWVTVHPTTHTGEGTLFDGVLDLHPTSPLRFETAATDKVLLYAQIPKNVIPTSGAVWSEELVSASMYLADDLPSDVTSISVWANKLVDLDVYEGYARAIGPDPTFATDGNYLELGAEAVRLDSTIDSDVTLVASKNETELGTIGSHVVTYGGPATGYSETTRPVFVGPIGPSVVGAGAPNVTQEIADLASVTVDVSQYLDAGGSTLRYEYSTNNHALATVGLNGVILTIAKTPNVTGTASITVTAIANEAYAQPETAKTTFHFAVFANNAPTVKLALPDVSGTQNFSLSEYFEDDRGQLTYSLTVEDPNVVNATLVGSTLYVQNGLFRDGRSLVTITATDGYTLHVSDALNATYSFAAVFFQFEIAYEYIAFAGMVDSDGVNTMTYLLKLTKGDGKPLLYDDIEEFTILMTDTGSNMNFAHIFEEEKTKYLSGNTVTTWSGDASIITNLLADGTVLTDTVTTRYVAYYFKLKTPTNIIDGAYLGYNRNAEFTTGQKQMWQNVKVYGTDDDPSTFTDSHLTGEWTELADVTSVNGPLDSHNPASAWTSLGATQPDNYLALLGVVDPPLVPPPFGGPNLVSAIPDATFIPGGSKTFNVASHFNATKSPGSAFKYFVTTNNHALLIIQNANQDLGTFELKSLNTSGNATVTVKVVAVERDVDVWVATSTFAVFVNNAPTVKLALPDVSGTQNFSLSEYFEGDRGQLTYSLTVEDPNVVNATLVGSTLYVQNGLFRDGHSLVTVTASDGFLNVSDALNASYVFSVTLQYSPPPSAFGGPNLVSAIPDTAVLHGGSKTFDVTSHFNATKTPASTFKYFVTTNNHALLEVRNQEDGTFELVSLNTSGNATVRVKAVAVERDVDVWTATSTFTVSVTVDEHDPTRTLTAWPDVSGPHTLNLAEYFADADGVEQLTFSATVSDASVVSAVVSGSYLVLENAMTTEGTSTAFVTITASDPDANVSEDITVTFSFVPGPSESDRTLTGISGIGWGVVNFGYFTTITSGGVEVPIGDLRYWMYSLGGYTDCCAGYQIQYDSQEDEWSVFPIAQHPNYDPALSPNLVDKTVTRSGGYIVMVKPDWGPVFKALDPFAT